MGTKVEICGSPEQKLKANKVQFTDEEIEEIEKHLTDALDVEHGLTLFLLGQFYYEKGNYVKALHYFDIMGVRGDWQSIFQMGIMYYDGLGTAPDHKRGFELMYKVATTTDPKAQHLQFAARYNIGRAYYHGFGVRRSEEEAEKYWLLAADDGNPDASIKAQATLGLFYTLGDHIDLKKAYYFHTEACGNGSLESQGALGVMFLNGFGVKKSEKSAYVCMRDAAQRGNIFAQGNLVEYYYKRKLFTKAVETAVGCEEAYYCIKKAFYEEDVFHVDVSWSRDWLADKRVVEIDDVERVSRETDCLIDYIKKGIAIACFYYARCLALGRGIAKDEKAAATFYSRSYKFDKDICANLQLTTQHGQI